MVEELCGCPFVYASGRRCEGTIYRLRAYGRRKAQGEVDREGVRKYRLWCSLKDDHSGIDRSSAGKLRMEFYPDQLPLGLEAKLWDGELLS